MSVFSAVKEMFRISSSINEGIKTAEETENAVLIDVRTREEYAGGHVPGSINIPLDRISETAVEKNKPLFVYCLSGARSRIACSVFKQKGYEVYNIGGISGYRGELERGG